MDIPYVDIFATKGVEYILVIGFLALFVAFLRLLTRPVTEPVVASEAEPVRGTSWFPLAAGRHYHPGHTWVAAGPDGTVRVGVSTFVGRLLGRPDAIEAVDAGGSFRQGDDGIALRYGDTRIRLLAPVDGEVIEVNPLLREQPERIVEDPYGDGWLFSVRASRLAADLRTLLDGDLAESWMEGVDEALRARLRPALGAVLQDGGTPVEGFIRAVHPDDWEEVACELLRCSVDRGEEGVHQ